MRNLSPKAFFIFLAVIVCTAAGTSFGQNDAPPDGPPPQRPGVQDDRPNLLRELGLTPEQGQQLRRLNQARKPMMDEAQQRLREANRALDIAIYSDTLSEEDVAARLKDFQAAQAEVARIRFNSELSVRKILTPEQLTRFRRLRERFARAREDFQNRRKDQPPERPIQQIRQLQRKNNNF